MFIIDVNFLIEVIFLIYITTIVILIEFLFDNTIESIKEFSPQTQLTNKKSLDSITIVNPNFENNINSIQGISLLSYLENRDIYSFNRSDIVLYDRINFLNQYMKRQN